MLDPSGEEKCNKAEKRKKKDTVDFIIFCNSMARTKTLCQQL